MKARVKALVALHSKLLILAMTVGWLKWNDKVRSLLQR